MSEQTTVTKDDEHALAQAADATSTHDATPSEEPAKGSPDTSMDTKQTDTSSAQVKTPAPEAGDKSANVTTNATSNSEVNNETKKDEVAGGDKVEEMVTERNEAIESEAKPALDESVEVKMETSTIEESKPVDDKVADVTNTSEQASQPQQATPAAPVPETKEPVADVKPPAPTTNEQPQQPKQPQSATLPTRQYLDATVVPILHAALSQLAKIRPEDPIHFLGTYLLEYKDSFNSEQK